MIKHRWTRLSLITHFILAAGVIIQLASSQLWDGKHAILWFQIHKICGVVVLAAVLILLLHKFFSRTVHWTDWYPVTKTAQQKITEDCRQLIQFKLPCRSSGGLPGIVQGLGMLLMLGMGLLGISWWIIHLYFPTINWVAIALISTHAFLSGFVWIYIIGHGLMAILHWVLPNRFKVDMPD